MSSGAIRVEEIGDSDNCYIICAHEYVGFASRLGIKQGQLILATSFPQDRAATSGVWIYAIRLEGADPRRLVDAWVTRISSGLALRESTISAKRVVVDDEYGTAAAYIYARSGVLFLVFGPVLPDGSTSADVRAALALLP